MYFLNLSKFVTTTQHFEQYYFSPRDDQHLATCFHIKASNGIAQGKKYRKAF